jgi:hypothetical protein
MTSMNNPAADDEQDDEISLSDIIAFLAGEWRKLVAGAVVGLVLSIGAAVLVVQYKAEAVILNANANANAETTQPPIDFLSWKYLQKSLPELARRVVELKRAKPDEEKLYKQLSDPKWWEKNVEPNFALSKDDRKNLAGVGKDLEGSAGSTILFFIMTDSAADKETAEKNLATDIRFMRTASTYWALRNLIRQIDVSMSNTEAQLVKSIGASEIEIDYLLQKAQSYEALRKRYPNSDAGNSRQVVEVKEGGAKYLPLDTQLVAVNTEILSAKESLTRMRDKQKQHAITKEFLQKALPALEEHTDGLALGNDLLATLTEMRKKLPIKDRLQQQALSEVESDVASILVRFDKGLRVSVAPQASKVSSLLKSGALGLFGGGVLMLLFVMGQNAWLRARKAK